MLSIRVGVVAGMLISGVGQVPLRHDVFAHQGKCSQSALICPESRRTPVLGQYHSFAQKKLRHTTTKSVHGAVRHVFVSAADWQKVFKVHECEQPLSWHNLGPTYAGGLGWLPSTWSAWRAPWMPRSMAYATPMEQAWAMVRFVADVLHYWPDQAWPAWCSGAY